MSRVKDERYISLAIDRIRKADWNYKSENPEMSEKLKSNIQRNGQIENIIVRELEAGYYEVVNGNHRLDCLQDLGYETVFVFNLGELSLSDAKRIAIETNETKFRAEPEALGGIIEELLSDFSLKDLSATMPFTPEELTQLTGVNPGGVFESKDDEKEQPPDTEAENSSGFFALPLGNDENARRAFEMFEAFKEHYNCDNATLLIQIISDYENA